MLKNYLKTAIRSLTKNRAFSIINILGLAIGMAACLFILQYVTYELSYDNFHANKDNLYRLQLDRYDRGELSTQWAAGCAGIGPALKENFPEVKEFVKMHSSNTVLSYKDLSFRENRVHYVTEAFFNVFSYKLLKGVDSLVLKEPYKMVISESTAKKYFKEEDPVGKTMTLNGGVDFEVTGVFEDVPENTHMKFDILYSFETYVALTNETARTAWQWDGFHTYILLEPGTDPLDFEAKLPAFVEEQEGEELQQFNAGMEFHLQPIEDIHLYSNFMFEFETNGDGKTVYALLIIAFFILIIAWVNYINLSTAKSLDRAREIGVRKVLGSYKTQLISQFLIESLVLNLLAALLAVLLIVILVPQFNALTGQNISFALLFNYQFWISLIIIFSIGAVLSGIYPAFIMSSFKPVSVLKGKQSSSIGGNLLRRVLVVFQFIASVTLIVGTITVYKQITYMRNQDLGVSIDQTLVIRGPNVVDSTYSSMFNTFKTELLRNSAIGNITASTAVPGAQPGWNAGGIRLVHEDASKSKQYKILGFDYDFVEAYGLEILAGRNFSEEFSNDQATVLFNQSAVAYMGFDDLEEALDKDINFWGDTFKIVGVLKDYHQESLKSNFEPLIFRLIPNAQNYYSVKIVTNDIRNTIGSIETEFKALFPGNPFDYFFLDDHFNQQYKADIQFGKVFGTFAGLAIFIACLGLFGLSAFTAIQRTKEIGIRKVMGASVQNILSLLTKDFSKLVLIAIVISSPISWYIMNNWLQSFAYKIELSWWIFLVSGLVVIMIALLTVSIHTLKAAASNPVKSLRYE